MTAEVDPAASAERRKQEYTADESEREAMTAKDATLREFDGQVLQLAQIINRAEPERFARTNWVAFEVASRVEALSTIEGGPSIGPGLRLFERGGDGKYSVLSQPGCNDLETDWKALAVPSAGHGRGRQARQVDRPAER